MIICKKGEIVIHIKSVKDFDKVRTVDKEKYHKVYIVIDNDLNFSGMEFKPIDASDLDIVLISKKDKNKPRKKIKHVVVVENGDTPETGFFSKTQVHSKQNAPLLLQQGCILTDFSAASRFDAIQNLLCDHTAGHAAIHRLLFNKTVRRRLVHAALFDQQPFRAVDQTDLLHFFL